MSVHVRAYPCKNKTVRAKPARTQHGRARIFLVAHNLCEPRSSRLPYAPLPRISRVALWAVTGCCRQSVYLSLAITLKNCQPAWPKILNNSRHNINIYTL